VDKSNLVVEKPVGSSRAEIMLIEENKRLEKALQEITNDRDRFARKYHDAKVDIEYLRQRIEEMQRCSFPRGKVS
jgi:hypothetical protein